MKYPIKVGNTGLDDEKTQVGIKAIDVLENPWMIRFFRNGDASSLTFVWYVII